MEKLTKEFDATIGGVKKKVKAIRIDDPKGPFWLVTASELLRLMRIDGTVKIEDYFVSSGCTFVHVAYIPQNGTSTQANIKAYGSCLIGEQHGLDPVGIATRRAVNNLAFMTGLFDDVFDKLREMNGGTLDMRKSDDLNDSLSKYL